MFDELMVHIKTEICHNIFRSASSVKAFEDFLRNVPRETKHDPTSAFGEPSKDKDISKPSDVVSQAADDISKDKPKPKRTGPKVRRNDPCPCGSAKKYQNCCGR